MGRKTRQTKRGNGSDAESEDEQEERGKLSERSAEESHNNGGSGSGEEFKVKNRKELDFAQRRELQRKQEADKRRSKMKCYLCGKVGHLRRECTGIADDGRGMSRYKGKSDIQKEQQKYMNIRKGRTGSDSHEESIEQLINSIQYPEEFIKDNGLQYVDVHCDIPSGIEYLRSGRGKAKISQREAMDEYRMAIRIAIEKSNLTAIISKTFLTKPNRPWINPLLSLEFHQNIGIYFVIGLTSSWEVQNEMDREMTIESLVSTIQDHPNEIIAIYSSLDTTAETLHNEPNMDICHQIQRLQCCCEAAGRLNIPLQIQVRPGAASLDPDQTSVGGTDYAKALLELQSNLATAISNHPNLRIHIVGWSGRSSHMLAMIQAFPTNLVAVGLDASVSFSKAEYLHDCAFELLLDRLILETSNIIPSNVANMMGRRAFPQSGWWPFVAESVSKYKEKIHSLEEVVSVVYENTLKLYPQLQRQSVIEGTGGEDTCEHLDVM